MQGGSLPIAYSSVLIDLAQLSAKSGAFETTSKPPLFVLLCLQIKSNAGPLDFFFTSDLFPCSCQNPKVCLLIEFRPPKTEIRLFTPDRGASLQINSANNSSSLFPAFFNHVSIWVNNDRLSDKARHGQAAYSFPSRSAHRLCRILCRLQPPRLHFHRPICSAPIFSVSVLGTITALS